MNYEVGKQYEMKVVDIRKDSAAHDYITLHEQGTTFAVRIELYTKSTTVINHQYNPLLHSFLLLQQN